MAKSPSRRSLKNLFSRSEANLRDTTEKDVDKNEGEKRRFRFFRFRRKSNSGSALEKPANESQQVFLSKSIDSTKANGDVSVEKNNTKSSLYATAPRSKGKELSYSDMDLRKPKKFATFSFGLKRRKKRNEESLSKSTYGLHSTDIEELDEPPPDLGEMDLDRAMAKKMSMSQPVLDTSEKFDIPSPPPVSANQSDSHFTLPAVAAKEPLTNGSDFLDVHAEPLKAPIASIPELQMDSFDLSEGKENIPVQVNAVKSDSSAPAVSASALDKQTLRANQPQDLSDIAELKAAVVELVSASDGLNDNDSLTYSTRATSLNHQLDAPDTAVSTALSAVRAKTPDSSASSPVHQEVSLSHTKSSISETVESVRATSAVSTERSAPPVDQSEVYGALYESLFPQSFTSEVVASLLNSQPQTCTEIQRLDTKTYECRTERTTLYSTSSTFRGRGDRVDGYTIVSSSGLKSADSSDLIQDTLIQAQNSAPPASDYVTSQGTDSQVTDPKRRAILVKELVTDETSSDRACAFPGLEKMDQEKDPEFKIDKIKSSSVGSSGQYFSVGSDDGSAIEIYYSAEEDNIPDSGDERVDERGEISKGVKEVVELLREDVQQKEITETDTSKQDEETLRVLIVKMQNEGSNDEGNREMSSPTEVFQQCSDTWTSDVLQVKAQEVQELKEYAEKREEITTRYVIEERQLSQTDEGGRRAVIVKMRESTDEENESKINQSSEALRFLEDANVVSEVSKEVAEYVEVKQEDVAETRPIQTEEEVRRAVIVKMLSEEINEDKKEDISSQTEVYQQIIETHVITSLDGRVQDKEMAEGVKEVVPMLDEEELAERRSSQTDEGGRRAVIVKMRSEEINEDELVGQTEVYRHIVETQVNERVEDHVKIQEEVKEVIQHLEELSKEEIGERCLSQTDEGGRRAVFVRVRSEEINEAKNEDNILQTEVYQQIFETHVIKSLKDNDAENQKEVMVTEIKEVVEMLEEQEIAERRSSETDEGGRRAVIVKMRSVESGDEKNEDISRSEVIQQILETQMITSLEDSDTKIEEEVKEFAEYVELRDESSKQEETLFSQSDEGASRAVILKMRSEERNDEDISSHTEVYRQILETHVIEHVEGGVKEDEKVSEEPPEVAEEVQKVLDDLSKQDDLSSQSEVYDQILVTHVVTSIKQDVAENQDKEITTEVFPEIAEDVKEVVAMLDEKEEIGEQRSGQVDEEVLKVLIVKMKSVENTDEMNEETRTLTEVQHELRGPSSEILDTMTQEKEATSEVSQAVTEGVKEVVGLLEELANQEEETSKRDEVETKVVVVEINNKGEETDKKEDITIKAKEPQQQSLTLTSTTVRSQEIEVAPVELAQVEEEVKELVKDIILHDETAEKGIGKNDEGVKEEKKVETLGTLETQHERPQRFKTERVLLLVSNVKDQEEEAAATVFPEVTGEVKQVVEVLEEMSKQEEIAEKEENLSKMDSRVTSVVGVTSVLLERNDGKSQQKEVAPEVVLDVQEVKQVVEVLEELSKQEEIAEKEETLSKMDSRVTSIEGVTPVLLARNDGKSQENDAQPKVLDVQGEVKQVVEVLEDLVKQEEVAEKEIKRDEGGKEAKKEETRTQTEVQRQLQSAETMIIQVLESSDVKTQEGKVAAPASLQVKEEGQEGRKEELLATPVGQVKALMVCDFAPPSRELHGPGEGSEGNLTKLETEDHPNREQQLPNKDIQYLVDKEISRSDCIHAASRNTGTEDTITPLFREAAEQVSLLTEANQGGKVSSSTTTSAVTDTSGVAEVVEGAVTLCAELQSDATESEHNRAPQVKTEWADTVTQSTDGSGTVLEQVAVELSVLTEDKHLPETRAEDTDSKREEQPAETKTDLNEGSLTASAASENPLPEADQESDDEMNTGYSSLSTKLSIRSSSSPKEDENRYRIHKLSLISDSENTESSQDTVEPVRSSSPLTESNGADVDSEYRWKNRFEGVSQFRPYTTENFSSSDSLSYTDTHSSPSSLSSLSSSSALLEATTYKHADNASFSSSSPAAAVEQHITLSSQLSDRSEVHLSRESEPADEWRRGLVEREEPAAPAGETERKGESEKFKSSWEAQQGPITSSLSPAQTSNDKTDSFQEDDDSARFTGVFKATLVELVSDPALPIPSTPPASPDVDSPNQFEMDSLVDTLKSMGPAMRLRTVGPRAPAPVLISSLPPIVEDAPSPISLDVRDSVSSPVKNNEATGKPAEPLNGLYTLPPDLGLKRSTIRDSRSPLELMKQSQQEQLANSPLRASATNSIVMRMSSDSSPEELKSPLLNGNGVLQPSGSTSRLDNSVIFSSYRAGSIDQRQENRQAHRPLFRTGSLPEIGVSNDRISVASKDCDMSPVADPAGSRFDRFSFLLNSSSSGSLTGAEDPSMRMSRPPSMGISSPTSSNSPSRLLSPTGSIDLQRPFANPDSPLSMFGQNQTQGMGMGITPLLQRSFSAEGNLGIQQTSTFNNVHAGSQFQSQEVENNILSKYRAFPDAYLTKEKEHGKLNPRPGKMYIFDRPGLCGQRIELRGDIMDATSWDLQETISIRVVRGGWVLYEKPNFKGDKIALDEGDIELTYPFGPPEEQPQNGQQEATETQNGETSDVETETKPAKKFIIGSLRRAVRDYSVPDISLFPEENAEGKKVVFRDTSDDARIFGFPIKANSIIINAGLWLVYAHPFFQGVPRVLEVGGYPTPAAWGVETPYVGSLHPLKIGEPRVENMSEPKIMIYEKPYFTGKSRIITTNSKDFMTRVDRQQTAFMYSVGSLKVLGGIWVGYEKEGYRGHQYLLEEGEYQDWRVWGGCDSELRSVRVIRADLMDPLMVMFEQPEEDQEGMQEENTFEVMEAIPDVELFQYKTNTRSIHVLSGAWVAYSHVDFSGHQYILEKGFYNNCADWGSKDNRICSVQPILLAPSGSSRFRAQVMLYSQPDFQGECHVFDRNQEAVPEKLLTKSCRVSGGSWALYEDQKFSGNLYVLSEGDYPNLTSMGCLSGSSIRSLKVVPLTLSVPSISLFGLECLEGREITTETEVVSMVEEGFNNHILSVRVNSGSWVICEHSNYRGRQFLLEPIEITNWPKFSSLQTVGSMYPVRQKRPFFRIKNTERGHFLSIQGGVEEMKSGRVVVTPEVEGISDIWFYQDGFIKSKMSPTMSLQVMGNIEPAAKVVLWTETRQPIQTWTAKMKGLISSLTFPGMVLDVKGGKTYDKDHVVIMPESEERPSQQWEIELL
ncbi:uncharacterized protein crybg2 [Halichoeres trimaculatus]|uniref:uncharacterized protein crybg2 n=1 Tax=Halichoeres trimaculatus TaxID=147232 RepID=UPI003D9EA0BB